MQDQSADQRAYLSRPPIVPQAEIHGSDGRCRPDPAAARVLALVSHQRQVSKLLLLHSSRCGASIAEARQVAMYLTHVVLRRTYAEVGDIFGRDRTTVSHACARIEDLRELPDFDAELARLETAIAAMGCRRELANAAG
jgi:hypothetical protein